MKNVIMTALIASLIIGVGSAFGVSVENGMITGETDNTRITVLIINTENEYVFEKSFKVIDGEYSIRAPQLETGDYTILIKHGNIGGESESVGFTVVSTIDNVNKKSEPEVVDEVEEETIEEEIIVEEEEQVIEEKVPEEIPIEEEVIIEEVTAEPEPIPEPETIQVNEVVTESEIPDWVRGVAGFWAEKKISDQEFINALEFLIKHGVLNV